MSERQTDFFEAATDLNAAEIAERMLSAHGGDLDLSAENLDASYTPDPPDDQTVRIPLVDRDPAAPFSNKKLEQFLRRMAGGANKYTAYWESVNPNCTKKSAGEQASRWLGIPANRARLRVLILEQKTQIGGSPARDKSGAAKATNAPGPAPAMTKSDIISTLEKIIQSTLNESTKIQAIERVARLRGFIREPGADKKEIPDPAYLGVFLRRAEEARQDPVEAAKRAQEGLEGGEQGEDPPVPKEAGPEASGDHAKQRGAQDVGGEA